MKLIDRITSLSPTWIGAAAAAAAAAAAIVKEHRIAAGALAGAGVLAFALYVTGRGCSSCAAAAATSTSTEPPSAGTPATGYVPLGNVSSPATTASTVDFHQLLPPVFGRAPITKACA